MACDEIQSAKNHKKEVFKRQDKWHIAKQISAIKIQDPKTLQKNNRARNKNKCQKQESIKSRSGSNK